jgi:hypothetical protein
MLMVVDEHMLHVCTKRSLLMLALHAQQQAQGV